MNDKQKQIEEMAKELSPYGFCKITKCENCNRKKLSKCRYYSFAKRCVMNGYRKQSDTVKEFVCKVLQIGSKRPLCLFNEYKEGYVDCLDQIKELAAEYGINTEDLCD